MGSARQARSHVPVLAGWTVGLTAVRRRQECADALERHGARVLQAPAMRIVDPVADDTLRATTSRCVAAPPHLAVATTAAGWRDWIAAADAWGLGVPLRAALDGVVVLARGPRAAEAVRDSGLRVAWHPATDSVTELAHRLAVAGDVGGDLPAHLAGRRVLLQVHGEPLPDVGRAVRAVGAEVIEVAVHRWVAPDDDGPLRCLLRSVAHADVDCVAFTSAPAAASFLRTAGDIELGPQVRAALRRDVLAACTGPVAAGPLHREAIPFVHPHRPRLGDLVREIVDQVPLLRGTRVVAGGHRLDVRGHAVVLDGVLLRPSATGMTLLRELARNPGHVVGRDALRGALGATLDDHAVGVAVGRLRDALGDAAIVQTVMKRGYRLAVAA